MPSRVLTTRVPPAVYDQLQALADRRGRSLAATAGDLLAAVVADGPDAVKAAQDGNLVTAVRALLEEVDAPAAVMHRELSLTLARAIERREPGYLAAVASLRRAVDAAESAQKVADLPPGSDPLLALLAGTGMF
ncbi:hypothetical protein [Streptomyces chryseus]|uniref:Uncharacterized protein n=2 Tax=Streptomyces chryseus TaxID=68186 RepID=A0ABQ3DEC2_9ACTN|nr:hypothetical protein [Streptomyces chryseus]GHA83085.1 hypothetical protein GCM10010346_01760 [Streptomyces chryseus]